MMPSLENGTRLVKTVIIAAEFGGKEKTQMSKDICACHT
jgi:hypothetical protein